MSKKEPKWFADIQGKDNMVAIGAASPHDPVFGGLIGINIWGDPINCLIYPNVSENTVKALIAKNAASVAVQLRDNLCGRPNKFWGMIETGAVTWVVYKLSLTDVIPVSAFVGEEPVSPDLFLEINNRVLLKKGDL